MSHWRNVVLVPFDAYHGSSFHFECSPWACLLCTRSPEPFLEMVTSRLWDRGRYLAVCGSHLKSVFFHDWSSHVDTLATQELWRSCRQAQTPHAEALVCPAKYKIKSYFLPVLPNLIICSISVHRVLFQEVNSIK